MERVKLVLLSEGGDRGDLPSGMHRETVDFAFRMKDTLEVFYVPVHFYAYIVDDDLQEAAV